MGGKRLLIIAAVVVAVLAGLVIWLLRGNKKTEAIYTKDTGIVLAHGWTFDASGSRMLISTNRNFVEYEPISGTATPLMNDGLLPDKTSNLKWSADKKRAIFEAAGQNSADVLGATVGSSPTEYWWLADFANKKYIPLGPSILDAGWVNNSTYYVVGAPKGVKTKGIYQSGGGGYSLIFADPDILGGYSTPSGFMVYSSPNGKGRLARVAGKETPTIADNLTRAPQANRDGSLMVMAVNKTAPDDGDFSEDEMQLLDTQTGETLGTLAHRQSSEGYWSSSENLFYFESTQQQKLMVAEYADRVRVAEVNFADKFSANISRIGAGQLLAITDTGHKLYLASSDKSFSVATVNPDPVPTSGIVGKNFGVYHYKTSHTYGITVDNSPIATYVGLALDSLRRAGTNPALLDVTIDDETPAARAANNLAPRLQE